MSIFPLPMFEADADPARRSALTDAEVYAQLKPPSTIVVRVGAMKHVAEYPYSGDAKPGCGSKLVARTARGTEIVEMLTTTCSNSGCAKSVSRQEMLDYIENSGGSDYPFHTDGQVLRVATIEDLNEWSRVQAEMRERVDHLRKIVAESTLPMKVVDVEPILGQELLTVYFMSEERVDFRELVRVLAGEFQTRIEMRQVGARDEARLVADYERCGQHCCCKNFLKVLKPVSMRSAKVQKATLDPLKISGRCGRLMCCLRYEDETYESLKKKIPKNKTRVGTSEGPGIVVDSKILVQLVLVQLESDGREIAVPIEELTDPGAAPAVADPLRGMAPERVERHASQQEKYQKASAAIEPVTLAPAPREESVAPSTPEAQPEIPSAMPGQGKRRRRRRKNRGATGDSQPQSGIESQPSPRPPAPNQSASPNSAPSADESEPARSGKRRRRRRRRGGDGDGGGGAPNEPKA